MSYVHNEAAYQNAIARNIKRNAAKTRREVWFAMPDAERVNDFLFGMGDFGCVEDATGRVLYAHPVVSACQGDFYSSLYKTVLEWGGLSAKQHVAALALIKRGEDRVAERQRVKAEQQAKDADLSEWVGVVKGRYDFTFTLRLVLTMDGIYGTSYLHVGADDVGRVIVYKGTKRLGDKGETVTVKATVKDHSIRDGVKQTVITRPA